MQTSSNYLLDFYVKELKFLKKIQRESRLKKIPIIDIKTGRFLETITMLRDPQNILEIGCGIGFSTYFLLKNFNRINYTGIDLNSQRLFQAKEFIESKLSALNTHFISGNALKILPLLEDCFDLVFIDAAKYEYPMYLEKIMLKTKKNSVIIADNILLKNKIFKPATDKHDLNSVKGIKSYIEAVSNRKLFNTKIIDIGDGVSVSIRK